MEFLIYLVKFIWCVALIYCGCSFMVHITIDNIRRHEVRKREVEMNNAVMEALKEGRFSVGVKDKDEDE